METQFAVITGASKGLGKHLAIEMAKRRFHLILISIPNSGQLEVAKFIEDHYNVMVFNLEYDLSKIDSYKSISNFIEENNLNVKYLINNAGVLSRGLFEELELNYIYNQIQVNITAPTFLIKSLLKNLEKNSPSGILNISSMAGLFHIPKKQVYGATKSYLLSFSESLRKELEDKGVSVTTLCPGGLNTTTKLCYQNRKVSALTRMSILNPEDAARIAISGMMAKKQIMIPGIINNCLVFIRKILPQTIIDMLMRRELKKLEKLAVH